MDLRQPRNFKRQKLYSQRQHQHQHHPHLPLSPPFSPARIQPHHTSITDSESGYQACQSPPSALPPLTSSSFPPKSPSSPCPTPSSATVLPFLLSSPLHPQSDNRNHTLHRDQLYSSPVQPDLSSWQSTPSSATPSQISIKGLSHFHYPASAMSKWPSDSEDVNDLTSPRSHGPSSPSALTSPTSSLPNVHRGSRSSKMQCNTHTPAYQTNDDDASQRLALRLQAQFDAEESQELADERLSLRLAQSQHLATGQSYGEAVAWGESDDVQLARKLQAQYEDDANQEPRAYCSLNETQMHTQLQVPQLSIDISESELELNSFIHRVRRTSCRECGAKLIKSPGDTSRIVTSWVDGTTPLNGPLRCKHCSAHTCGGCGSNGAPNFGIPNEAKLGDLLWCCDESRLLVVWLLLCSYEYETPSSPSQSKLKDRSESLRARGLSHYQRPKGVGYGGMECNHHQHPSFHHGASAAHMDWFSMSSPSPILSASKQFNDSQIPQPPKHVTQLKPPPFSYSEWPISSGGPSSDHGLHANYRSLFNPPSRGNSSANSGPQPVDFSQGPTPNSGPGASNIPHHHKRFFSKQPSQSYEEIKTPSAPLDSFHPSRRGPSPYSQRRDHHSAGPAPLAPYVGHPIEAREASFSNQLGSTKRYVSEALPSGAPFTNFHAMPGDDKIGYPGSSGIRYSRQMPSNQGHVWYGNYSGHIPFAQAPSPLPREISNPHPHPMPLKYAFNGSDAASNCAYKSSNNAVPEVYKSFKSSTQFQASVSRMHGLHGTASGPCTSKRASVHFAAPMYPMDGPSEAQYSIDALSDAQLPYLARGEYGDGDVPYSIGVGANHSAIHGMGMYVPSLADIGSGDYHVSKAMAKNPVLREHERNPAYLEAKAVATGLDRLTLNTLELLCLALPSSNRSTSFDVNPPPALLSMISLSSVLDKAAELLRNDSIEDATKRQKLYHGIMDLVIQLGSHEATLDAIVQERPGKACRTELFEISKGKERQGSQSDHVSSIAASMENLVKQSRVVLGNAQRNLKEFLGADSQDMLSLCRHMMDVADHVSVGGSKMVEVSKADTADNRAKDWEDWQKAHCMLDVPDEEMFAAYSYAQEARTTTHAPRGRMKRLIAEGANLSTSLPPGIFVRYASSRPDVLKVLIVGPADTPYEGGLFEFDVWCPSNYPNEPPKFTFKTTGRGRGRLNPNLYEDGKVCLSLLNTWPGERWKPEESTLLQVLVSLQSMVFCDQPYYNEPGFEMTGSSYESKRYDSRIQALTVRLGMIDWLQPGYKTIWMRVVREHFQRNGRQILGVARSWASTSNGEMRSGHIKELEKALQTVKK